MEDEVDITIQANTDPQSEEDWIIHAVNIHGVFFERVCRKIIENTRLWSIRATNLPVSFPPPDSPYSKESNLDICASLNNNSSYHGGREILSLLIEGKKNNPEFVKWLFFPKHSEGRTKFPGPLSQYMQIRKAGIELDPASQAQWLVQARVLRHLLRNKLIIADDAREVRGSYQDYKGNKKTKTANDSISEAAYQVALATQALFIAETQFLNTKLQGFHSSSKYDAYQQLPWVTQVFLPMIVTSARLFTCAFTPDDIDVNSGVIPYSKAAIVEHQSLLYEYALPRHLQSMALSPEMEMELGNMELFIRMHITVVNSGHLENFLKDMAQNMSLFFD